MAILAITTSSFLWFCTQSFAHVSAEMGNQLKELSPISSVSPIRTVIETESDVYEGRAAAPNSPDEDDFDDDEDDDED